MGPARRLRHVGIPVSNLSTAEAFYRDVLGFREVADFPDCRGSHYETLTGVPGASIHIRYLELPTGDRLELLAYDPPKASPGPAAANDVGRWHLSVTVNDLHALYVRARAQGVVFVSEPVRSPDGVVDVCYCWDPDGNLVELVEEINPPAR